MDDLTCLKLLDETVILERDDKVLFLVPSKPDWILTNKNVAEVLRLCNGKNTIGDIRHIISAHSNSSEAIDILCKLHTDGFFEKTYHNAHHNSGLNINSIHLNMASECNLRCIYCYAAERKDFVEENLSLNEYFKLVDEINNLNKNVIVTFTGGEPLLNTNSLNVAEYCKSEGMRTFLLTNGICVNPDNAVKIASLFDTIRISIDGCTESVHDKHRGKGSYKKAVQGMTRLESCGAAPNVAMTVTRWNMHQIQGMADRYGSRLTFQPLYEVGNAKHKKLGVTGVEYFESLKSASGVEPYGRIGEMLASIKNRGCARCAIGEGEISISPSGDVYPCHMLHVPQFLAGNIKTQSFRDIYENSNVLKEIRKLSVTSREDCQECPFRLLCAGGCWARAFYEHGDLNTVDGFCEYEIMAFREGLLCSQV